MRWLEIVNGIDDRLAETQPSGGAPPIPPLTPAKARAAHQRDTVKQAGVNDVKLANRLRLQSVERKANENDFATGPIWVAGGPVLLRLPCSDSPAPATRAGERVEDQSF
jgi:hypothetical protein